MRMWTNPGEMCIRDSQKAIEAGVPAVMMGNVICQSVTGDEDVYKRQILCQLQ